MENWLTVVSTTAPQITSLVPLDPVRGNEQNVVMDIVKYKSINIFTTNVK